jgi:hypothetical protein
LAFLTRLAPTYKTAYDLLKNCEGPNDQILCGGYIMGSFDASMVFARAEKKANAAFCAANEVTVGQLKLVVVKYLNQHPEDLHTSASANVIFALHGAFPCK